RLSRTWRPGGSRHLYSGSVRGHPQRANAEIWRQLQVLTTCITASRVGSFIGVAKGTLGWQSSQGPFVTWQFSAVASKRVARKWRAIHPPYCNHFLGGQGLAKEMLL